MPDVNITPSENGPYIVSGPVVLTAPDGRSYAVAVMIKLTSVPLPVRMTLMNDVVRAVIAQHDLQFPPKTADPPTKA